MSIIERSADHIVGETRVIRIRRTVDGRKCSDDIIEGSSRGGQSKVDKIVRDSSLYSWLC